MHMSKPISLSISLFTNMSIFRSLNVHISFLGKCFCQQCLLEFHIKYIFTWAQGVGSVCNKFQLQSATALWSILCILPFKNLNFVTAPDEKYHCIIWSSGQNSSSDYDTDRWKNSAKSKLRFQRAHLHFGFRRRKTCHIEYFHSFKGYVCFPYSRTKTLEPQLVEFFLLHFLAISREIIDYNLILIG